MPSFALPNHGGTGRVASDSFVGRNIFWAKEIGADKSNTIKRDSRGLYILSNIFYRIYSNHGNRKNLMQYRLIRKQPDVVWVAFFGMMRFAVHLTQCIKGL